MAPQPLAPMSPAAIQHDFFSTGDAAAVLSARSAEVENVVISAWKEHLAAVYPSGMALLAVGGFGRQELFPQSDIDLLILVERDPAAGVQREALSSFLRRLWDAGLRLSQSVRTTEECCRSHEGNLELTISLLDQRYLVGDEDLYERQVMSFPRFLAGERQRLARRLVKLARERYAKAQATIYHLEPNIKEHPGGLRDLHVIGWLEKLNRMGTGAQPVAPAPLLEAAEKFIFTARCYLHYRFNRDNNQLTFEAQDGIVEQPFSQTREPEQWMREYFRHARNISQAATRQMEAAEESGSNLLAQFRDWRSRLSNADFTVSRERVFLRVPAMLERDPMLVMRLFQFVARHGMPLALETERRLAEHTPAISEFFSRPGPLWPALRELLLLPNAAMALRVMQQTGIFTLLFPEWRRIECLVVRDFYHRYTVDEHTLIAFEAITQLSASVDPSRRRFADLLTEIDQPALLLLAILLHDAGKGGGEGHHVAEGLLLAEQAMERIQLPDAQRDAVRFLIARHLELSNVMTSRDLDDPVTVRMLADRVETLESLKRLTLLTYADISAVNPEAMTPWRLQQLWHAYLAGYRELTRELESERIQEPEAPPVPHGEFVLGFPKRYLHTHSVREIQQHVRLADIAERNGVAVDVARANGVYQAIVIAGDRPGLFASLAGALASFGMNIVKAEAFSNRSGKILDTFSFADPSRTLELNPTEVDRLRITLERVALGRADSRKLLESRPRPILPSRRAGVQPTVNFDMQASVAATLIEIVAQDRPGLLYDLANSLTAAGCNIEVVLIDTQSHKAFDVFYVTKRGQKLDRQTQDELKLRLLKACES